MRPSFLFLRLPLSRWRVALAVGALLAVVFGAMGWVTVTALRLERSEAETRRQGALEENARLALWRMDSGLAPMIAAESARPYFAYAAYYSSSHPYSNISEKVSDGESPEPSPLLTQTTSPILLHFQIAPDGRLTSPQYPVGRYRQIAQAAGLATAQSLRTISERLTRLGSLVHKESLENLLPSELVATATATLQDGASGVIRRNIIAYNATQRVEIPEPSRQSVAPQKTSDQGFQSQADRNAQELRARANAFFQNGLAQQAVAAQQPSPQFQTPPSSVRDAQGRASVTNVEQGLLRPLWIGGELILARRIRIGGQEYIQGCWLDWAALRRSLLSDISDLLPQAGLAPVLTAAVDPRAHVLASLPARLIPGNLPPGQASAALPMRPWLLIAWGCALVAAGAVAALLIGAVSLSERRGAFVSAVTHELRTPLTTFRMYTEMLDEDMVQSQEKRAAYLRVLREEAERLGRLVENVLAYARLESRRPARSLEAVTLETLLERVESRLHDRATQADMRLEVRVPENCGAIAVRADLPMLEQILFNLVDNACKYANAASDHWIGIDVQRDRRFVVFRVRDHGPGISKTAARRLFRPFSRSARDAAGSAPGVGLGLALCRRLAGDMGGDLRLDGAVVDGACFVLTLRRAKTPQ